MLRVAAGILVSLAVVGVIVHTRARSVGARNFISANLPPIGSSTSEMEPCPEMLSLTKAEIDPAAPTALLAPSADTGATAKPFYVLTEDDVKGKGKMGGCKCGTSVCTIGRLCDKEKNMCFLPPCPLDGLEANPGTKKVPETYTAGCWCADARYFGEWELGSATQGAPDENKAFGFKLYPAGSAFADSKTAVICRKGEYCNAVATATQPGPVCYTSDTIAR